MRYCGACGSPLTTVALIQGVCLACGAAIEDLESATGVADLSLPQEGAPPGIRPNQHNLWDSQADLPTLLPGGIRASSADTAPEKLASQQTPSLERARERARRPAELREDLSTRRKGTAGCALWPLAVALALILILIVALLGRVISFPLGNSLGQSSPTSSASQATLTPSSRSSSPSPAKGTPGPTSPGSPVTGSPVATPVGSPAATPIGSPSATSTGTPTSTAATLPIIWLACVLNTPSRMIQGFDAKLPTPSKQCRGCNGSPAPTDSSPAQSGR